MSYAHKKITPNSLENWNEVKKDMNLSLYQEKKAIAIKLIKQGTALDFISKVTYLTKNELLRLLQEA